ncbi:iron chelate uptake ABC transporter family permease subunit [Pseudonocardia phyllosphaerae]|uniref:iron chelate uptake ABC transporter family permease subunit n=1 Tax=Pseudonocardia phyllosphaerae TaxID=3390502 RepID=UPI00397D40AE
MRRTLLTTGCVAAAAALAALVLGTGSPAVPPQQLPAVLAGDGPAHVLVTQLRLPRLVLGVLAGAALGAAGMLLQTSLRNPLAVPELLGVSSGAAAAVAITIVTGAAVPFAPLLPAVLGAAAGGALTLLAVRGAVGPAAVLLIGAGVGAALQALLLSAVALTGSQEQGVLVRYLLGSLTGTTWPVVAAAVPGLVLALPAAVAVLPALELLRLGDTAASVLGLRTGAARAAVLGTACLLVASVVGPCGPVAWVGFLAPQVVRFVAPAAGPLLRLACSAGCGAVIVVVADLVARSVLHPVELPAGGLTAVVAIALGGVPAGMRALRRRPGGERPGAVVAP